VSRRTRPEPSSAQAAPRIAQLAGASSARRTERIQQLWDGYGEAARYELTGGPVDSVVVKEVRPGAGRGRSHDRKLRSYQVEQAWYGRWASRCGPACRVPRALGCERADGRWLFVLEDLDAAGFPLHTPFLSDQRLAACLRWLAAFHATFLGERPSGLWKIGTYWHLKTRPDELSAMARGPLRDAAGAIDARLNGARFLTLVHGDAKPSNFCFSRDGRSVAAVDFQYVGGGCGMKDVAYLLAGEDRSATKRALDLYFGALRRCLAGGVDGAALEAEWRTLFAWAWADFERFLAGWDPHGRVHPHGRELTRSALAQL
jgi:aminoglycoside phosphotransferase (APT) family kinase protein